MNNNNNNDNIINLDVIKWAFEKGYRLACDDVKDSIHINFSEIENYFLEELIDFHNQKNNEYMLVNNV